MNIVVAERQRLLDLHAAVYNGGFLDFYTAPQPLNGDEPLSSSILLGTCGLAAAAFAATNSQGIALANPCSDGVGFAAGVATWARATRSDHVTVIGDLSVGALASSAEIILTNISIQVGGAIHVQSLRLTFSAPVGIQRTSRPSLPPPGTFPPLRRFARQER